MIRYMFYWLIPLWLCLNSPGLATSFGSQQSTGGRNYKELLNGRIWRNEHLKAVGSRFYLSDTFLKGSVVFNGKKFNGLDLQYDIADDELLLRVESYPVIILNKEMVDSFTLNFESRSYKIINAGIDTLSALKGYVNLLYDGPSALYIKYSCKLYPLAIDGRYDLFYMEHRVYVKRGPEIIPVPRNRMFFRLLADRKKEVRHYIRSSGIRVNHRDPATYARVLSYYDSLK